MYRDFDYTDHAFDDDGDLIRSDSGSGFTDDFNFFFDCSCESSCCDDGFDYRDYAFDDDGDLI